MQGFIGFALSISKFVILPIGILLLAGATYSYWSTRAWLSRSVEAQGLVIEMVQVRDRDTGSISFAPLVRFQAADGRTIDFQSSVQSNPPAYTTGQPVTVLYDPAAPNSAAVSGLFSIWGVSIILTVVGLGFMVFGLAAAIADRHLRGRV